MNALFAIPEQVVDRPDPTSDLLPTLTRTIDPVDAFRNLARTASDIGHEAAYLGLFEGSERVDWTSMSGDADTGIADACLPTIDRGTARLVLVAPNPLGLRAGIYAPIRIDDDIAGAVLFLSRRRPADADRALARVESIAALVGIVVGHRRLMQASHMSPEGDAVAAVSDELLRSMADALDIREIFPRVSSLVSRIIPHDHLTMSFHNGDGRLDVEATSNPDTWIAGQVRIDPNVAMPDDGVFIVGDLLTDSLRTVEPDDLRDRLLAAGFRAMMCVHLSARHQEAGLQFWSRRPYAFHRGQVPAARRIAEHVALAVSHEQLAESARLRAEAEAHSARLGERVRALTEELSTRTGYGRIVGSSPEWQAVLKAATQVAVTDATVLLAGESGTGKEVVARFIHGASARASGPFVALNCAALPEQLLESELFGHERGAFTGAQHAKPGQIELAAGGTLFLDEISEMTPAGQAKFLRVLQEREFVRVGGTKPLKANVRIIAATNRELEKAVARGEFREDLYYRLHVFDITLPPLRERRSDILPMSEAFLDDIGRSLGRPPAGLTREATQALLRHNWPGNVRELRNVLERAAILCEGGLVGAEHLVLKADTSMPVTSTNDLRIIERDMIAETLRRCGGNKSEAARQLGLSRTQLYVRLRKYGIPAA